MSKIHPGHMPSKKPASWRQFCVLARKNFLTQRRAPLQLVRCGTERDLVDGRVVVGRPLCLTNCCCQARAYPLQMRLFVPSCLVRFGCSGTYSSVRLPAAAASILRDVAIVVGDVYRYMAHIKRIATSSC